MRNGDAPRSVYGLWSNTGTPFNEYSINQQTQFRIMATGSFDIKNHSISLGFEYEQRRDSRIAYAPRALWTLTRQYQNSHLAQQDSIGEVQYVNGIYNDTINYGRLYGEGQYQIDYNIRQALGLDPLGNDRIDIDSYDPEFFDINWFAPDELLNNGNYLAYYYGFDAAGNKQRGKPTFDDFFTETDEFGNFTRKVGAFEPIYIAGYIQDEFTFKDLIFRVGVRVDRFDANQKSAERPIFVQ